MGSYGTGTETGIGEERAADAGAESITPPVPVGLQIHVVSVAAGGTLGVRRLRPTERRLIAEAAKLDGSAASALRYAELVVRAAVISVEDVMDFVGKPLPPVRHVPNAALGGLKVASVEIFDALQSDEIKRVVDFAVSGIREEQAGN